MSRIALLGTACLSLLSSCALTGGGDHPTPTMDFFGYTENGDPSRVWTLTSSSGVVARLTDYGATLVSLHMPQKGGESVDVVLGFDDVSGYESKDNAYFGCTVGRVANRIRNGVFELDSQIYELAANDGPHHLHGGLRGFGNYLWNGEAVQTPEGPAVRFRRTSAAGEEGYPGELEVEVLYTLTSKGDLRIDYLAQTNQATPISLTHHSYFNLAGEGARSVLDHELQVQASQYTPGDLGLIPTGVLEPVEGTPLDFREPHTLGERIEPLSPTAARGYDHNYVLEGTAGELREAATLTHPASGRSLEVWTTEPGLQVYSGNFLFGQLGKGGHPYRYRSAVCLEPQGFPNAVNQPNFPSVWLRPGEEYRSTSLYRFRTR